MDYKIEIKNNIRYITIPKLKELGLENYFTTRDLNMRLGSPNQPNGKIKNYTDIFTHMNIEEDEIFSCKQNHTRNIQIIDSLDIGKKFDIGKIIDNHDGLITNMENIVLVSKFADCTPILLYDPKRKVQTNIHSGWKGTLQEIGAYGVELMTNVYGSNPKDILAVLGPSISTFDFEVDKDVMESFKDNFNNYKNIIYSSSNDKYLIDLNKINTNMLLDKGLVKENICNIDLSTKSNPMLHSYRRDKGSYELMALLTCIKS